MGNKGGEELPQTDDSQIIRRSDEVEYKAAGHLPRGLLSLGGWVDSSLGIEIISYMGFYLLLFVLSVDFRLAHITLPVG